MKKIVLCLSFIVVLLSVSVDRVMASQNWKSGEKRNIADDVEMVKVTDNVYMHVTYEDMGKWGIVASNGLVVLQTGKAFMIDSPMSEQHTEAIYNYVKDSLGCVISYFVPGHFHDDCVGGMQWLEEHGVKTCANEMTNDLLKKNGKPIAQATFTDSYIMCWDEECVECHYMGGGHSVDNIVVWIPKDGVLFGGCMVKDMNATSIGNLSDAVSLKEWFLTIERVKLRFSNVKYVIPGHGDYGGMELLDFTQEMLKKQDDFK